METLLSNRSKLINAIELSYYKIKYTNCSYSIKNDILNVIKDNRLEDYLSATSDPEVLEYSKNKDHLSKRISTSFARYCRRQLKTKEIPDSVLDSFSSIIKLELSSVDYIDKDITLLSGYDISNFYKHLDKFSALKSCMSGENFYKTEFYSINPDKVKLVNYNDKARALLWTSDNGKIILDRVYPTDCSFQSALLQKWAREKGYLQDITLDQKLFITLNHNNIFPFLDTFHHGKVSKKKIRLCNEIFPTENCTLRETSGSYTLLTKCFCCKNVDSNFDFEMISHEYVCKSCIKENYRRCEHCVTFHHKKDMTKINKKVICKECFPYYCKKCDNCNGPLIKDYVKVTLGGFEKHLCEDCSINYYTCNKCNIVFDQLKNPKNIKRGIFFCGNCIRKN